MSMWRKDETGSSLENAAEAYHQLRSRARDAIERGDRMSVDVRSNRVRLRDEAGNLLFEGTVGEAAHLQFGSDILVKSEPAKAPPTSIASRKRPRRRAALQPSAIQLTEVDENTFQVTRDHLHAAISAGSDAVYRMSADWSEMQALVGNGFIRDTATPFADWLDTYIPEDDRPPVLAGIDQAIRDKTAFNLTHRVIRADGSVGWTRSCAVPVVARNGDIREWIGAADDVTTRQERQDGAAAFPSVAQWNAVSAEPPSEGVSPTSAYEAVIQKAIDDWTAHQTNPVRLPIGERLIGSLALLITRRLMVARLIGQSPNERKDGSCA